MTGFYHIFKQDYDKRLLLGGHFVFGYSPKKMRELYPDNHYAVVGEVKSQKALKKKNQELEKKNKETRIGQLHANEKSFDVFPCGNHKSLLHKPEGYICIGEDKFVAVYSSRLPFLVALTSIITTTVAIIILILWLLLNPKSPVIINPDHPLPDIDPEIETLPPDDEDKVDSENGGGFVSMVYTKEATVSLSTNKAQIYYQNPNKSNHSVLLELYLVSEGKEYFLGRTGLIPAGSAIYEMDVSERDANIRTGVYTGLYRTFYYDPLTGERAVISSDITEVTIYVTE